MQHLILSKYITYVSFRRANDMTCQLCVPLISIMHIHLRTDRENIIMQQLWNEPVQKRKYLYAQL
jgi:hypothetical protein